MPRGLDHTVHAVRDLDAAAALYRKLGFTVGARNRHPWGTHNHIVQFPGYFIELLTFAEPDRLGDDGFSRLFAAFNRDFIARGQGLSLQILESADAAADAAAFRAAGIAQSDAMRFEREGKRPDGSAVKVAFSLAFAENKAAPDVHFAVCQQHYPENFWNPAYQQHPNGVTGIAGVVAVASSADAHRPFMEAFTGATAQPVEGGIAIATPRGVLEVVTPAAFTGRYGVAAPPTAYGARLAALRFTVPGASERKVIGPQEAMGATLVFDPAG
jgi:hypothetical protein